VAQTLPLVTHKPFKGDFMSTDKRNSHGLYDAPVPLAEKESIVLSQQDLEDQLDAGAFLLDMTEAIESGFINPYDDDTVSVSVRRTV
jgi:hypothetical protein